MFCLRCPICLVVCFASSSWSATFLADRPLVLHELLVNEAVSVAAAKVDAAHLDLAEWRFEQLDDLRSRGFASWLEMAQQRVWVETMRARVAATDQYRVYLQGMAERVAKEVTRTDALSDRESVRLFVPGSPRLVGWLESHHLTPKTVIRQRELLQQALAECDAIDPSAVAQEVEKAARRVAGLRAHERNDDAARLRHAELNLRLVQAELALARASLAQREVLERRLALLPAWDGKDRESQSTSYARSGTLLVDITCDPDLASMTRAVVLAETSQTDDLDFLESQKRQLVARIKRLKELARHPWAGQDELSQAQAGLENVMRTLDQRWVLQQQQLHLLQAIDDADETTSHEVVASKYPQTGPTSELLCHATALRHLSEIQRARFQVEATRQSMVAQCAHLREYERRLNKVADRGGDRPGELQHVRDRVLLCEQQIRSLEKQNELLRSEEQRFVSQFAVQYNAKWVLVQDDRGQLVRRNNFRDQGSPWLPISYLSSHTPVVRPREYPLGYIESPAAYKYCTSAADDHVSHTLTLPVTMWRSPAWFRVRRNLAYSQPATVYLPTASRLALAADSITYPKDLSCYVPFDLGQLDPGRANIVFRSRLNIYSHEYAFGIRRIDSGSPMRNRPRANAYHGPWYLPGLPTNFR